MRRTLAAVAAAVAVFGLAAPPVFAQAPAPAPSPLTPKVTIVGLFDTVTSASKNVYDGNFALSSDADWYARTRFRPDFEFSVGRVKAVLGVEIDVGWGACGLTGTDGSATAGSAISAAGCRNAGSMAGGDLNTDIAGIFEVKWAYVEFPLTGKDSLLPFIPVETVARAGAQPFAQIDNYKALYANRDFSRVTTETSLTPNFTVKLGWVAVEDHTHNVVSPVLQTRCTNA